MEFLNGKQENKKEEVGWNKVKKESSFNVKVEVDKKLSKNVPVVNIATKMPFKVETYFLDTLGKFQGFNSETLKRVL